MIAPVVSTRAGLIALKVINKILPSDSKLEIIKVGPNGSDVKVMPHVIARLKARGVSSFGAIGYKADRGTADHFFHKGWIDELPTIVSDASEFLAEFDLSLTAKIRSIIHDGKTYLMNAIMA